MQSRDAARPSEEIIRIISPPHCARGPRGCDKCREAAEVQHICLLRVFLDHGEIARPMIQLVRDGESRLYEYDVLKYFESETEAVEYAEENGIIGMCYYSTRFKLTAEFKHTSKLT